MTTSIEAATNAVRIELNKMAHDPKEIARKAIQAFLQAEIKLLDSTGEHATEDFFAGPIGLTFPNEPRIPRLPAVFCNGSPPEANNVVQTTQAPQTYYSAGKSTAFSIQSLPKSIPVNLEPLSQPEAEHNFRTSELLKIIEGEGDKKAFAAPTVAAGLTQMATPGVYINERPTPEIDLDTLDHKVVTWLYRTLNDFDALHDNQVLELTRTPAEYGLDSLDEVEIVMMAEEEFDIELADDLIVNVETFYDLIQIITQQKDAR